MAHRSERWQVLDEVASTNDTVHAAAERGEPEGLIHVARRQTAGRGRAGRSWWSPDGAGLWMTMLLRPHLPAHVSPSLSLLAGKAVKNALDPLVRSPIELKWPNDLSAEKRKLGGILGELRCRGENYWIALGVGINIDLRAVDRPDTLKGIAISLVELGSNALDPLELGARITATFWPLYDRYQNGERLSDLVGTQLARVGSLATITVSPTDVFDGRITGLGERGELLVETADGTMRAIAAGDVVYHSD